MKVMNFMKIKFGYFLRYIFVLTLINLIAKLIKQTNSFQYIDNSIDSRNIIYIIMSLIVSIIPFLFHFKWNLQWNKINNNSIEDIFDKSIPKINTRTYIPILFINIFFLYLLFIVFTNLSFGSEVSYYDKIILLNPISIFQDTISQLYVITFLLITFISLIKRSGIVIFIVLYSLLYKYIFNVLINLSSLNGHNSIFLSNDFSVTNFVSLFSIIVLVSISSLATASYSLLISGHSLSELKCQKLNSKHYKLFISLIKINIIFLSFIFGLSF